MQKCRYVCGIAVAIRRLNIISQTKYYLHSKIYNIGKSEWQTLLPLFDESFTWQTEAAAAAAVVVVE